LSALLFDEASNFTLGSVKTPLVSIFETMRSCLLIHIDFFGVPIFMKEGAKGKRIFQQF
jgi:hypothetical protein